MNKEQADKIISLLESIDEKLSLALGIEKVEEDRQGDEIIKAMNAEKEHCC